MGIGNTAVSGMQAAMSNMDLISNNIANSQTAGFKRSYASFADIFPSGNGSGGAQIGSGVLVSSVNQDFTKGPGLTRGGLMDVMISGSGFFTVKDDATGQVSYTRNGEFKRDIDGYITTLDGRRVQGYQAVNNIVTAGGNVTDLQVSMDSFPPKASTQLTYGLNLDSTQDVPVNPTFSPTDTTSYNTTSSGTVYDSLGGSHLVQNYYVKTAANAWTSYTYVDGVAAASGGTNNLTFSTSGQLTSPSALAITFAPGTGAATPQALTLNIGSMTQYGGKGSQTPPSTDGFEAGSFANATIDQNGNIIQNFTNGQSTIAGQIAIANFAAQSNLQNIGDQSWIATTASGAALYSGADSSIQAGQIEGSNVELTRELVDLINAQNAFQANAQSEKTFSEIMQTVIQL